MNRRRGTDQPVTVGTVLRAAVLVTFRELVVDITCTRLDPRVQYS